MKTTSPNAKAPLALQTFVASQLTTLDGMAKHLVLLANGHGEIRSVAVAWFCNLPKRIQVDLIKVVGRDGEAASQLVMLSPDASVLMPHLGLAIVRRVCDKHPTLLTAVTAKRLATMVRVTHQPEAQREWLMLITEWCDDDQGRFESFLDELDPAELADWLSGIFNLGDINLLQRSFDDPDELVDHLDDMEAAVRMIYVCRPELYQAMIQEIILRLSDRYERRSRLRTQDELQHRYLPTLFDEVSETEKERKL